MVLIYVGKKRNAVEDKINHAGLFYRHQNQSIHLTDGMTVMSLSPSLLQKISVTMDFQCQIMLNSKLSHQF
jgi:hypothetical protein